ncbi:zinc finger protein OZF-like isoform X1 [Ptychodera flava]|uniref:zinc finger protein OZF-like isoform X1 n=2 Tax=Ptychodera flava TaxID=63121 RepID=UPI00396A7523
METAEFMNKDRLSDLEACGTTTTTTCNGGCVSALNISCGVLLSLQECCSICKALKNFDKMHDLVKPFQTLTEMLCQQYRDNALSLQDSSIIVRSLVLSGLITLEYDVSDRENSNEDVTQQHEGDHIECRTTLHKDSLSLVACHSYDGEDNDGEISNDCGKIYMNNSNDGAHSLNYSGAQQRECGECVETFKHSRYLKGLALIHSYLTPFRGSECGMTLNQNLETPLLTNSNIKQCESKEHGQTCTQECDLINANVRQHLYKDFSGKFAYKGTLKTHMPNHFNSRPYECKECGKTFPYKYNLKRHILIHSDIRQHECGVCGRKFSRKSPFMRHLQIHSGDRPHECKVCGKRFIQKYDLKNHMLLHLGIRPYECEECGKTFTQKSGLKRHMLTHSNIRPHECKECGKGYKQKCDLFRHMMIHSGVRQHECNN